MQNIAIDLGYGSVKALSNKSMFKFPSAVALNKRSLIDSSEKMYNYNGFNYLLGEEAMRDAYGTRDYTFLEKFAPLLLFKAVEDANLNKSEQINLITGLSLLNWDKKEQFAHALENFIVNNTTLNINLTITPQGKGIYLDCLKHIPSIKEGTTLVVDIGYNTLDVIPFENGKPLAKEAWANSHGVNIMVNELDKYIVSKFGMSLNETKVNEAFQRQSVTCGTKRDLSPIIDEEKQKYVDSIFQLIQTKNSEIYKSADTIIIAGGGAYSFNGSIQPQEKNIIFPRGEYEYSNVRGYYESLING